MEVMHGSAPGRPLKEEGAPKSESCTELSMHSCLRGDQPDSGDLGGRTPAPLPLQQDDPVDTITTSVWSHIQEHDLGAPAQA